MSEAGPAQEALTQPVFVGGRYKPFGEFTADEVRARAEELAGAAGWGPTAKVATVARGWSELARTMASAGAATVADLGTEGAAAYAQRLWVIPPRGGLL